MKKFNGKPNLTGRPKGAVNKTTAETKELLQSLISKELDGIPALLDKLEPKERIDAVIKLLPYLIPKQTEISVTEKNALFQPIQINISNDTDK